MSKARMIVGLLVCVLLIAPSPAFSYIDPGAGSMLLQLLLAGAAGLLIALKLYWKRIKVHLGFKAESDEEPK